MTLNRASWVPAPVLSSLHLRSVSLAPLLAHSHGYCCLEQNSGPFVSPARSEGLGLGALPQIYHLCHWPGYMVHLLGSLALGFNLCLGLPGPQLETLIRDSFWWLDGSLSIP